MGIQATERVFAYLQGYLCGTLGDSPTHSLSHGRNACATPGPTPRKATHGISVGCSFSVLGGGDTLSHNQGYEAAHLVADTGANRLGNTRGDILYRDCLVFPSTDLRSVSGPHQETYRISHQETYRGSIKVTVQGTYRETVYGSVRHSVVATFGLAIGGTYPP